MTSASGKSECGKLGRNHRSDLVRSIRLGDITPPELQQDPVSQISRADANARWIMEFDPLAILANLHMPFAGGEFDEGQGYGRHQNLVDVLGNTFLELFAVLFPLALGGALLERFNPQIAVKVTNANPLCEEIA